MLNKITKGLLIVVILFLLIKVSCVILRPRGDARVFLGLKFNPSQENIINQYDEETEGKYPILYSDEIMLRGENILLFIFKIPYLLYLSIIGILIIIKFKFLKNKNTL